MAELGNRGMVLSDDVSAVEHLQAELHDFVTGATRGQLLGRLEALTVCRIRDIRASSIGSTRPPSNSLPPPGRPQHETSQIIARLGPSDTASLSPTRNGYIRRRRLTSSMAITDLAMGWDRLSISFTSLVSAPPKLQSTWRFSRQRSLRPTPGSPAARRTGRWTREIDFICPSMTRGFGPV